MTEDSYKIVISISHHRISYEYWQRDGEKRLVPMPDGNWPAPLAFFCSGTGIIVGEDAARAAHTGIANAFDNYFERSTGDGFYTIGGQTKPIRCLLLDVSESIFRNFFSKVLFSSYGSLSDNRDKMPLTIVCESDILPNESALLHRLFKNSGYNRVRVVKYGQYLNRYINTNISKKYGCSIVVAAWAEDTDLTFSIFDAVNCKELAIKSFENLGIDPRKKYVEDIIWADLIGQDGFLQRENEENALSAAAADILSSSRPLVKGEILLSNGYTYHYSLNRMTIDCIQSPEGKSIKESLEKFLADNGITDRAKALLILRGVTANNSFFEQNLCPGFPKTIKADKKLRDDVMNLIISEVIPETPPPPAPIDPPSPPKVDDWKREIEKRWKRIRAEAKGKYLVGKRQEAVQMLQNFLSDCQTVSGIDEVIAEIKAEIAEIQNVDPVLIKSLERQWREIKASSKGKLRSGNTSEALSDIKKFRDKVQGVNGADKLIESIDRELFSIQSDKSQHPATECNVGDVYVSPKSAEKPQKVSKTQNAEEHTTGQELIKQGKLKEARDWYRAHNDSNMAGVLTEIIRAQKGIELRKSGIEDCRKTRSKDQRSRIIKEIQEYIELCEKAGINTAKYKKLLAEYKGIKL